MHKPVLVFRRVLFSVLTRLARSALQQTLSQGSTTLSWARLTWAAQVLLVPKALQGLLVGLQGHRGQKARQEQQALQGLLER